MKKRYFLIFENGEMATTNLITPEDLESDGVFVIDLLNKTQYVNDLEKWIDLPHMGD